VVVGQTHIHNGPNHNLPVNYPGFVDDCSHRKDSIFRLIDNGVKLFQTKHTHGRQGKGASLHVIRGELTVTALVNEFNPVFGDFNDRLFIDVPNNRNDQTIL
jgi:hypothetical protein